MVARRKFRTLLAKMALLTFDDGDVLQAVDRTLRTAVLEQVNVGISSRVDLVVAKERIRTLADGAGCRLGRHGRCGAAEECERADSNRSSALCRERHEATVVPSTSQRKRV